MGRFAIKNDRMQYQIISKHNILNMLTSLIDTNLPPKGRKRKKRALSRWSLTVILTWFTLLHAVAQSVVDPYKSLFPNVIEPAPTSKALQKFLGYPVSHATGLVDITIPLYELKLRNLSIPISLRYHSSGIKIQDHPGIVGYGWSLFPGFKISRTIMGKPDDKYPVKGGFDPGNLTFDQLQQRLVNLALPASYLDVNTTEDGQYDIFSIHLPNLDGSFIVQYINGVFQAKSIPDNPLAIKPIVVNVNSGTSALFSGFEVMDDKGVKYIFGNEANFQEFSDARTTNVITGWMLKEILLPNGEKISIEYTTILEYPTITPSYCSVLDNGKVYFGDLTQIRTKVNQKTGGAGYNVAYNISPSADPARELKVPSVIRSKDQTITFNYTDIGSRKRLSSIAIPATNRTVTLSNDASNFLRQVAISGEGAYNLDYYNQPSQFSQTSIDWWGFFNNAGNENNIPRFQLQMRTLGSTSFTTMVGGAFREPSATSMEAKSLKSITYPTGGIFTLKYEPHKFIINGTEKIGAGLRVTSTESFDPVSGQTVVKSYQYEDAHYTAGNYPIGNDFIKETELCYREPDPFVDRLDFSIRSRTISTFSPNANISNNSTPVWYGKVIEFSNEGKTEYHYEYFPDANNNRLSLVPISEFHVLRVNRLVYSAPRLLRQQIFKRVGSGYEPVKSINNIYSPAQPYVSNIQGYIAVPFKRFKTIDNERNSDFTASGPSTTTGTLLNVFGSPIAYSAYYITTDNTSLTETLTATYSAADSTVEKIVYTYDAARPYNLAEKTTLTSDEGTYKESYYYTNNTIPNRSALTTAQNQVIAQMNQANYKTTVIQQTLEKGGKRVFSNLVGYKKLSDFFFLPETQYSQLGSSTIMEAKLNYLRYDNLGNVLSVSKPGAPHISYVYGYNGLYPIAKIENLEYSAVEAALNGNSAIETFRNKVNPTDAEVTNFLLPLRSTISTGGRLMNSYTYRPLFGISSNIDPSGRTTYYNYDSFGRLEEIKDTQSKTTDTYEYHYRQ